MARAKLTQLLGDSKLEAAQTIVQEDATGPTPTSVSEAPAAARPVRAAVKEEAPIEIGGGAHYLTFVRKETRLREDQMDALAAKARQINRNKADGGERITDNTLIRIAVDLLLARADKLTGSTADELRNSGSSYVFRGRLRVWLAHP